MGESTEESGPKPEKPKDGKFEIVVSPDKLTATLEVTPADPGGSQVAADAVFKKISELGIQGVSADAVSAFLKSENFGAPLTIARGTPAQNGRDGSVEYLFMEKVRKKKEENELGRVDHREFSSLIFAKDGELLAKVTPPTPGEPGKTVFGDEIAAVPGKSMAPTAGQNVKVSADGIEYSASHAGQVVQSGTALSVDAVLVCEGDVNFDVGNIDFDGSVTIGGTISEGFTVKATGDISAQTVSKANVEAGRNVVVEKGIIGSPDTHIKAKGDVTAKFVENANVTAGGNIVVSEIILHSNCAAARNIVVRGGKHCSIVGGYALAGSSIEAHAIGADTGTKTQIEIGLDPETRGKLEAVEKELAKAKDAHEKAGQEIAVLTKLKERMKKLLPAKETHLQQLQAVVGILSKNLKKHQDDLAALQRTAASAKPGFVSVKDKIFRGSHITVLDQTMSISKEYTASRFYFNRDKKSIEVSNFKEIEL